MYEATPRASAFVSFLLHQQDRHTALSSPVLALCLHVFRKLQPKQREEQSREIKKEALGKKKRDISDITYISL